MKRTHGTRGLAAMVLGKMGALQACRTYCSPGCKTALTVHVSRLGEYVMFQVKFKNKQTKKAGWK